MTFLLLNAAQANDYFTPSEDTVLLAKLNLCEKDVEAAVKASGETLRIPTWESCHQNAEAAGEAELVTMVRERLAVLKFEDRYAAVKTSDPIEYARVVLGTAAQFPTADIPMAMIRDQWLQLIADHEARNNISLRQVKITVISAPGLTDEEKAALEDYLRRFAISAGFKAPEGYSAEAADSDIFVQLQVALESGTLGGSSRATLYEEAFTIKASSVRFKKLGTTGEAIEAKGRADYVEMSVAKDRAMEAAASDFADQLLMRAVTELFGSYQLP